MKVLQTYFRFCQGLPVLLLTKRWAVGDNEPQHLFGLFGEILIILHGSIQRALITYVCV